MQTAPPTVSVVIPAYNAERTIGVTLASVLGQTVSDIEVIVVDDGSTDGTARAASSLGDPRVRVVHQPNAGHAAARNTGIADARGTYVALIDADDLWLPEKLERQLTMLRRQPGVRAVQCGVIHVDDSLRPLFIGRSPNGMNTLLDVLCLRGLPGLMSTLMAERSVLVEVGCFDPALIILQDWDLAIRLARRGELYSMSEPMVLYRMHASSQSKQIDLHIEPGERILANVFADPTLPSEVRARRSYVYARFYAMLSGGALQIGRLPYAAFWARRAIESDPRVIGHLVLLPVRRMEKRLSRRPAARLVHALRS
jgi:glycosyltransferase involved in cell wall biosynthesis